MADGEGVRQAPHSLAPAERDQFLGSRAASPWALAFGMLMAAAGGYVAAMGVDLRTAGETEQVTVTALSPRPSGEPEPSSPPMPPRRATAEPAAADNGAAPTAAAAEPHAPPSEGEPAAPQDSAGATDAYVHRNMPESLSRGQVIEALERVRPDVQRCVREGGAEVEVTVRGDGLVAQVSVRGEHAGTPQGRCVAEVVRRVRFPAFQRARIKLIYPFSR